MVRARKRGVLALAEILPGRVLLGLELEADVVEILQLLPRLDAHHLGIGPRR